MASATKGRPPAPSRRIFSLSSGAAAGVLGQRPAAHQRWPRRSRSRSRGPPGRGRRAGSSRGGGAPRGGWRASPPRAPRAGWARARRRRGPPRGRCWPAPSAMGRKSTASTVKAVGRLSSRRRTTMYHLEPAASLAMRKTMAASGDPGPVDEGGQVGVEGAPRVEGAAGGGGQQAHRAHRGGADHQGSTPGEGRGVHRVSFSRRARTSGGACSMRVPCESWRART